MSAITTRSTKPTASHPSKPTQRLKDETLGTLLCGPAVPSAKRRPTASHAIAPNNALKRTAGTKGAQPPDEDDESLIDTKTKRRSPIPREWAYGEAYDVPLEDLAQRMVRAIRNQSPETAAMYRDMIEARLGTLDEAQAARFRTVALGG